MKKIICGVYIIISPSGKVYIGHSKDIYNRWDEYFHFQSCKTQKRLYNSFLKYGVHNHIFQIIQECKFEELNLCERYWQDFYDVTGKRGLNCKLTQTHEKKQVFSEEVRKKISNGHKGKKLTEEHKKKIGLKSKGRKGALGHKHTDEAKKKISEGHKGKIVSDITKEKLRIAHTGKKQSQEQIKNRVLSRSGWKQSEESKIKIGNSNKIPVLQFTKDMVFIKSWCSMREAATALNISESHIGQCCRKNRKTCGGFKWEYKNK